MSTPSGKRPLKPFYRRMVILLCLGMVPLVFDRMDREFVVPQQLKKLIDIMDVQTATEEDWWRARIQMRHRGFEEVDVSLNLTWLDSDGDDIGKSQSIREVVPGDTVIVRLSMKAAEGRQAVSHHLDYTVNKKIP